MFYFIQTSSHLSRLPIGCHWYTCTAICNYVVNIMYVWLTSNNFIHIVYKDCLFVLGWQQRSPIAVLHRFILRTSCLSIYLDECRRTKHFQSINRSVCNLLSLLLLALCDGYLNGCACAELGWRWSLLPGICWRTHVFSPHRASFWRGQFIYAKATPWNAVTAPVWQQHL